MCRLIDRKRGASTLACGSDGTNEEEREQLMGVVDGARKDAGHESWHVTQDAKFCHCDEMVEADSRRISPNGIQGRRYFDFEEVLGLETVRENVMDLAKLLKEEGRDSPSALKSIERSRGHP